MPMIGKYLRAVGAGAGFQVWCPGCGAAHYLPVNDIPGVGQSGRVTEAFDATAPGSPLVRIEREDSRFSFNGDFDNPTFSPDLLIHTGKMVDAAHVRSPDDPPEVCHSDIIDGAWHYLPSSSHALAGQTVNMVEWPEEAA